MAKKLGETRWHPSFLHCISRANLLANHAPPHHHPARWALRDAKTANNNPRKWVSVSFSIPSRGNLILGSMEAFLRLCQGKVRAIRWQDILTARPGWRRDTEGSCEKMERWNSRTNRQIFKGHKWTCAMTRVQERSEFHVRLAGNRMARIYIAVLVWIKIQVEYLRIAFGSSSREFVAFWELESLYELALLVLGHLVPQNPLCKTSTRN